jgi:hypothetical protein
LQEDIAFKALDNGILSCADPRRLQKICDGLSAAKIDALLRKWLRLLPHPLQAGHGAGSRSDRRFRSAARVNRVPADDHARW